MILHRLERYPSCASSWTSSRPWMPEVIDAVVGTGAVHTLDFKDQYGLNALAPEAGLPVSPLEARPTSTGFRRQ